jgi:hypothetical protein
MSHRDTGPWTYEALLAPPGRIARRRTRTDSTTRSRRVENTPLSCSAGGDGWVVAPALHEQTAGRGDNALALWASLRIPFQSRIALSVSMRDPSLHTSCCIFIEPTAAFARTRSGGSRLWDGGRGFSTRVRRRVCCIHRGWWNFCQGVSLSYAFSADTIAFVRLVRSCYSRSEA